MKDYLYQAPEPMRDFLTYMETIMGRSPLTVKNYFMDLRLFSRWLMQHRNLVSADQPFDHIDISKLDLHFYDTVSKSEIYDFMLFLSRERPQHSNSPTTRYGIDSNARARKTSALRSFYKYLTEKTGQIVPRLARRCPSISVSRTACSFWALWTDLNPSGTTASSPSSSTAVFVCLSLWGSINPMWLAFGMMIRMPNVICGSLVRETKNVYYT